MAPPDRALAELLAQMRWARALAQDLIKDPHAAEDLSQDLWVKALERPPRAGASPRGWIFRVLRNGAAQRGREQARRAQIERRLPEPQTETPADTIERLETVQMLGATVRGLPEPHQSAILLHYFEGLSVEDLAARTGCTRAAAESRLRRGRELIRIELDARADAARWRRGLALLAMPSLEPAGSATLTAGALLLLATFVLAPLGWWLASRLAERSPRGAEDLAGAATPRHEALGAGPGTEQAETAPLRSPAPAERLAWLLVRDAESGRSLDGVPLEIQAFDPSDRPLASASLLSAAPRGLHWPLPASTARIAVRAHPTREFSNSGEAAIWYVAADEAEIRMDVPVWRRHGSVSGVLTDEGLRPAARAEIGVWYGDGFTRGQAPSFTIESDDQGRFRLEPAFGEGLTLTLAARGEGIAPARIYHVASPADPHAQVTGADLSFEPGHPASVQVFDPDLQALGSAQVLIEPGEHLPHSWQVAPGHGARRPSFRLETGADGSTAPVALGDASWTVEIRHPRFATWSGPLELRGGPTVVRLEERILLTGSVAALRDGGAVPGARVIAVTASGEAEAMSDESGAFALALPSAPAEAVDLLVLPAEEFLAARWVRGVVPERDGRVVEVWLAAGAPLRACLVDAAGAPLSDLTGLGIRLRSAAGDLEFAGAELLRRPASAAEGSATAALQGATILIPALPLEPFRLVVTDAASGILAEAEILPGEPTRALRAGDYPDARGEIRGRVLDADTGAPVSRCRMLLRSCDAPQAEELRLEIGALDGAFRVRGLAPGEWELLVHAADARSGWARRIRVLRGEAVEAAPLLAAGYACQRRFVLPNGAPAAFAQVHLVRADGALQPLDGAAPWILTDAQGRADFLRLPRGVALLGTVQTSDARRWTLPADALDPALPSADIQLRE